MNARNFQVLIFFCSDNIHLLKCATQQKPDSSNIAEAINKTERGNLKI
jgi:hypothetical protein